MKKLSLVGIHRCFLLNRLTELGASLILVLLFPLNIAHANGFVVDEVVGELSVRLPRSTQFIPYRPGDTISERTEVLLLPRITFKDWLVSFFSPESHHAPVLLKLSHPTYGAFSVDLPGQFLLDEETLSSQTRGFRMTETEDIPSRIDSADGKETMPLERLFAFFIPQRDLPSIFPGSSQADKQSRFPIVVTYPEQVQLLQTNTLPVLVHLEWKSHPDHNRPYKIYLWSEDTVSTAPIKRSIGETASIQISDYGRYFWQIEDGIGRYASAPRTILVRPLGADSELAAQEKLKLNEKTLPKIETIQVEFPIATSIIYACPAKGDSALPLRFFRGDDRITEYEIEYRSSGEKSKFMRFPVNSQEAVQLTSIPFSREGPITFRVKGAGKTVVNEGAESGEKGSDRANPNWIAASDTIRVQVQNVCGVGNSVEYFERILESQGRNGLPTTGGIVVMSGVL